MQATIRKFLDEMTQALGRMDEVRRQQIAEAASLLIDCYARGNAVFICGNGGSAADAQHIAAELTGRFLRERRALACTALTTNTSTLTAVANDYGYDVTFSRQVEAFVRAGDILWIISTSGHSPNVIAAARQARARGAQILGFTGEKGGDMKALCDVCFVAPAQTTYTIQQLHQLAYHAICDLVEQSVTQ
jgi:D-sedoheptulose 7-phosphate isomerase